MGVKLQIGFISLGCPKNQVDTEIMMGLLKDAGHTLVNRIEEAEFVVINTCGFITSAQEEGIQEILKTAEVKKYGHLKRVIATGCLAQRFGKELLEEIPELDGVVGISTFLDIPGIIERVWQGERVCEIAKPTKKYIEKGPRILSTPSGYAYLKIAEGCNHKCSYCAIPNIRGRLRSRPMDELVKEAEELARRGCKELIIIGQDTAAYGQDLKDGTDLSQLLRALEPIEGIEWMRLLYLYPHSTKKPLIDEMKRNSKVLPYMDIPMQHIHDDVLKRMYRPETTSEIWQLIRTLRSDIPGLTLRTTFMVGFPGETDEEFQALYDFAKEIQFDWMGSFIFDPQEGTKAFDMPDPVPSEVSQNRQDRLMQIQQHVTRRMNEKYVGTVQKVLITGRLENQLYIGHAAFQAPEIDGASLVRSREKLEIGTMVPVFMKAVRDYDMIGEVSK